MTTTTANPGLVQPAVTSDLVRTARITGLFYLGLAVTGLLGFLIIRNQLFVADDAAATLSNLVEHETLARWGIVMEVGIVFTQTLAALWFFQLFRGVDSFAAASITAFGLLNSVAIIGSAVMLATALEVAGDAWLAAGGDAAATVQLMYVVSGHFWGVGALFFGLWLIPMGWLVLRSGWMPRLLGWILMVGGVGYVLSVGGNYLLPDAGLLADLVTIPASIGEFWILGYLLVFGVRRRTT